MIFNPPRPPYLGGGYIFEGLIKWFDLHDHAGAAAIRDVVDRLVPIGRPVAQVINLNLGLAASLGAFNDALVEIRVEDPGEDSDDMECHASIIT